MSDTVQVTARQAAARLEAAGIGGRQARRVLSAGLAGVPVVTPGAVLYDLALVEALRLRPQIDEEHVDTACPWGLFIARREIQVGAPTAEQLAALSPGWAFSPWTSVWLRSRIERHGHVPAVATVGGFVTIGAEIVETRGDGAGAYALIVRGPGSWFDAFRGHRLPTGPGRPWVVRRPMGESST
jgi:hypothetical protein